MNSHNKLVNNYTHVLNMEEMSEKIVSLSTCQPKSNDNFD